MWIRIRRLAARSTVHERKRKDDSLGHGTVRRGSGRSVFTVNHLPRLRARFGSFQRLFYLTIQAWLLLVGVCLARQVG